MRFGRLSGALLGSLLGLATLSGIPLPLPATAATLDPSLEWHSAETEHFVIYWYSGEELAAKKLLEIAEPVWDDVTRAVDWKPKSKTHVVLTDVTDTANGFAVSVPFNTIRLFVTAPQEGSSLENYDDWLRMLFTHELTHIVHIDKVGGLPWLMRGLFGSIIDPNQIQPRWIVEGYATYQETQLSTAGRGRSTFADMLIRAAVLEGEFPPISRAGGYQEQWPGGYVPYIFGVQFLQHLGDRYGHEMLQDFTRRTGREPFPFFPFYPRLNRHAKKTYGKSFYKLWREWKSDLHTRYEAQKAAVEKDGHTPVERLTRFGGITQAPRISPDGKRIVYSMSNGKGPSSIRIMDVDGKNDATLLGKYSADGFAWSPDGAVVAFGTEKLWRDYYVWSDVYTLAVEEKRLERITRGARARNPDFRPDGTSLLFVTNDVSNNDLAHIRIDQKITWLTDHVNFTQYSTPRWSPDGKRIAVSAWLEGGYRDILLLNADGSLRQRLTADRFLDRDPTWSPDGKYLLFSSDRTGIANLYAYEEASGRWFQATNVLYGAFQPSVGGEWIVFQGYGPDGYDVFRTKYDPAGWKEIGWTFDPEVYDATCAPPKESAESGASGEVVPGMAWMSGRDPVAVGKGGGDRRAPADLLPLGAGFLAAQQPEASQPDPTEADVDEKITKGGRRPKDAPDKNDEVDLSPWKPRKGYQPWRTMAPRYWLPAQVWFTESGAIFGAFTGGTDPLFRHSYSAWVNYNTSASFVGGGFRYFYDRFRPTLYGGADAYVLDYGQSVYEYPDLREPGSHVLNIHQKPEHYFERHLAAQFGAYYFWRNKYFLSFRYLIDDRQAHTDIGTLTYDPFLPVRGTFAGPSLAMTYDRTEAYRWSISPEKGYRVTATVEAQEPIFGSDYRKEIGTIDARGYLPVPFLPYTVLGLRGVAAMAQGDDIRPSTFRLGGALGESVFSFSTPNYYSLRGFPFFAFGGERMMLGSAELRFPLWRVQRGVGTGPIYLRTLHGAVFADSGLAWNGDARPTTDQFHTGVGGELRADTIWFYYFPITIRMGYAFALNDDPAGYAPGDPYGLILTLGTSF